jgi:hypothetical protein
LLGSCGSSLLSNASTGGLDSVVAALSMSAIFKTGHSSGKAASQHRAQKTTFARLSMVWQEDANSGGLTDLTQPSHQMRLDLPVSQDEAFLLSLH